jgi:uncharacterized LabA/DUF88 family protein
MAVDTEAVDRLATDPGARVMVFVDGQNLYKTCQELFGHPLCHPHLLAEHLAGLRTKNRIACRYYTGKPDPHREPKKARNVDRRLGVISRYGTTLQTRVLNYHWDWGHRKTLPDPGPGVPSQKVTLHPWERPHEKGIDVLLALDVIDFLLTDMCDVAIIVSLDKDLREIPVALRNLAKVIGRPYRIEAAVPVKDDGAPTKRLKGFHFTHQVTPSLFELIRDDTHYNVAPALWVPPKCPATLAEARAAKEAASQSTS